MLDLTPPVPEYELDRIFDLSSLDLDYSELKDDLKNLTELAAKLTDSPISLVNLIDSFTQWSISSYGLEVTSIAREDSVCQYTIAGPEDHFEVKNLAEDIRFKDKFYVKGPYDLRYYLGVPLKSADGFQIGALCVLNTKIEELNPEKVSILKIIANEIIKRLHGFKKLKNLSNNLTASQAQRKTLAGDIREPLAGIISILQVIIDRGEHNNLGEVLELIGLIQKSSNAMLNITDTILDSEEERKLNVGQGDLLWLKQSLETLYMPQCVQKNIGLKVIISARTEKIPFLQNKLLQIAGTLIAYAIKLSPDFGKITVNITLKVKVSGNILIMAIEYFSIAHADAIDEIFGATWNLDKADETEGTRALTLVKELVNSLNGEIDVDIIPGKSSVFNVSIPQNSHPAA
jgi:signal transduction histidine kinase